MSRALKFRIWSIAYKEFVKCDDLHAYLALALSYPKDYIVHQYINIDDINGREIYEGDIIVQYPDNYQIEKVSEDVYEIKYDRPRLPLKDIIIYKGFVYYYPPQYWLRTLKIQNMVSGSTLLFFRGVYEVIGNVLENPNLLKNEGLEIDVEE